MAKRVRLLVVCGTGIATSTAAENKVVEWLTNRGYNVSTSQCIAAEVSAKAESINPHAIVTTTKLPIQKIQDNGKTRHEIVGVPGIPAFNGVPFLTGIGEEKLVDRICAVLDESKKM